MRGKVYEQMLQQAGRRITPAYAGKRGFFMLGEQAGRDHPRVCGEKRASRMSKVYSRGSPPRMRGKVHKPAPNTSGAGITPAYAGKSPLVRLTGKALRGSPPRMRGKGQRPRRGYPFGGITPAYAGKSRTLDKGGSCRRDHPRVCGEKLIASKRETLCTGSPPRMRGKEVTKYVCKPQGGITPAYAGKRVPPIHGPSGPGDHPRVCGEKLLLVVSLLLAGGSPPRMRGKD